MDIYQFLRIIVKKIWFLILIPFVVAGIIYALTLNMQQKFKAETTIFTGITSNSSLDNMGGGNVDYFATQNAYNNILSIINSKSVMEETSLRLLSQHLVLNFPVHNIISEQSFHELQKIITNDIKDLIVKDNQERTYINIKQSIEEKDDNFVYALLNYNHPHYSIKALSGVEVSRIGASDMINISYKNNDAGITYNTVKILSEVFVKHHNLIKGTQTGSAVEYFEKQLAKSANKLKESEDELLKFNTQNEIINYYEQTKHISSQQEKIDVKLQEKRMDFMATDAVLDKMEIETKKRFNINLRNKEILVIREDLIKVNEKIAALELDKNSSGRYGTLIEQKDNLELALENKIDSLYVFESNSQGIEQKKLLGDWLESVTQYESAKAQYAAMKNRKVDFMKQYRQYAPLGAKLKRIEREISVNEQEYLEILHHLGLARLKQQNAEMQSDMKILDDPKLPIDPMPTKRKVFVIVSSTLSVLFYIISILIMALLDKRVRTSTRLKELTNNNMLASFNAPKYNGLLLENINEISVTHLLESVMLSQKESYDDEPFVVQLFSNWKNEGKTFVGSYLKDKLESQGNTVNYINYSKVPQDNSLVLEDESAGFVIIEYPPISKAVNQSYILEYAPVNIFVVDAMRTWSKADIFHLDKLKKILDQPLNSILVNAHPDDLEDVYGEIPKKRGTIRMFIKKVVFKRIM